MLAVVGLGLPSRPLLPPFADEVPVMVPEVDAARRCVTAAERDAATRRVDDCATARTILPVVQCLVELYAIEGCSAAAKSVSVVLASSRTSDTALMSRFSTLFRLSAGRLAGLVQLYVILVYVRQSSSRSAVPMHGGGDEPELRAKDSAMYSVRYSSCEVCRNTLPCSYTHALFSINLNTPS